MIALGYVLSFTYMALVICIGELVQRKFNLDKEMTRKCEHVATALSWIICYFFVGTSVHMLIINLIACAILGVIAFGNLMSSVEREDTKRSYGLFYYGLSTSVIAVIVVFINPEFIAFHGIAWFCLAFGDGFAPIFAKIFNKINVQIIPPKTIMGMLAVFVFSFASVIVFNFAFTLSYGWVFMLSVACLATLLEVFGKYGMDNFYVTFGVFGYLVLNFYGLVTPALIVAIIISLVLVIVAAKSKALTNTANAISFCFLLLCAFCGSWSLMTTVAVLFVLSGISAKVVALLHKKSPKEDKKSSARGSWQIVANSIVAAVLAIVYYITNINLFLLGSIAVIGEEFADTIASDFGKLSRRKPIDILRFKRIAMGISGGVSLLGTGMALVGAIVAMLIPYLILGKIMSFEIFILLCFIVFIGTIIDSILGSGLQALYKCNVCDSYVENGNHCNEQAVCVKGFSWLNNSMVNLLSGIFTAIITCLLLAFIL
ncbi:MAG: DUF92 domain-containing protein [Clostridiales bacterium]|nr:DUF92 domain-containing protein [Clostridiales bacterium]